MPGEVFTMDLLVVWLLLFIKLLYIKEIKGNLANEVQDLTEILFANLNADPVLTNELSERSINFINKKTENYVALMKNKYGINHHWLTKRNIEYGEDYATGDYDGSYVFNGFSPWNFDIAENANDIFFINQNNVSSIITFRTETNSSTAFYREKDSKVQLIFDKLIKSANKMLVHACSFEVFVITTDFKNVIIYTITNDTLKQMQILDRIVLIDIMLWENTNGIFLAIIKEVGNSALETTCIIYKWLGKHFDQVQEITTYGAKAISAASVRNVNFLGIAKYQDDEGKRTTYSEIFRYNVDTEKYEVFQNVLSSGAIDIHFFSFKRGYLQETFLVVANSLEDENRMPPKVNSIIYKYVNKYFFPFQSIAHRTDKWLPITGPKGEFLLISSSETEGMKIYNYDGWRFVEFEDNFNDEYFKHGTSSIEYEEYNGSLIIKSAKNNFDNEQIRLYTLNFHEENNFKNFQEDILDWCQKAYTEIRDINVNELVSTVETSPKVGDMVKEYSNKPETSAAGRQFEDIQEEYDGFTEEFEELKSILDQQLADVTIIKDDLDNYLEISEQHIEISSDIIAKNVFFEKDAFFEDNLMTETINMHNTSSILDSLININDDYNFGDENIIFDSIKVEEMIEPNYINGKVLKNLILVNDSFDLNDVIVNGKVIAENGLNVGGNINGVYLNSSKILLTIGDQKFNENITLKTAKVINGESDFLNKLNLRDMPENSLERISNIHNLKVKDLFISNFLNDIDIKYLNESALRTFGEQEILGDYTFENLQLKNLFVENYLFNKDPNHAILISQGEYNINKDVLFTGDINAKKIHVKNSINHLKVDKNGKLDVLLKNTEEDQYVSGYKIFEDVVLLNPINLQVKIDSNRMDNMNPITIVPDEEIIISGHYNFTGRVTVEQLLFTRDMRGSNSVRSVQDVIFEGLEIDNAELPQHFTFQQQLNVGAINVDMINDINPDNFVINGNDILQDIKGWKTIKANVHITGSTILVNANNINIPYMASNTLRTEGDQEIDGKHILKELITTSVSAKTSKLGDHLWRDIVQNSEDEVIYGTTVVNSSVLIQNLKANFTEIEGLLNGHNLIDLLEDTAKYNATIINAHKTFERLEVENLFVTNGVDMDNVTEALKDYQKVFVVEQNVVVLPDGIKIENLRVDGKLNDMNSEDFTRNWIEMPDDQLFHEEYIFDTLSVYGMATILSNGINGISLEDIAENTMKRNETYYFNDVEFKKVIVTKQPVILQGEISGLDLENIIVNSRDEQAISGFLTFADDVEVTGNLEFNGLVNGVDYDKLCEFSTPNSDEPPKNLIITGNARFLKEPSIARINNVSLADLYDDIWLSNKDATLTGHIEFEIMNFEGNVTVQGLVDDIDVVWLSENYFSKTKNQTITGHLDFTDGVNFLSDVSAPEMKVQGLVSGENIFEFIATAILDNADQIFENTLHLDVCNITYLQGEYLVNQLNLPNDVMRYDAENIVIGEKHIPNVITHNLVIDQENIAVQNVDMLGWIQKGVLKSGGSISKDCIFHNDVSFSKGLGVIGLVNGVTFDNKNIMMRNEEQVITGRKRFYSSVPLTFDDISLKSTLNGVNMNELLQNQAFKDRDNVFKTQININRDLTTTNLNINSLYNGVNITDLIANLSNLTEINNYFEHYSNLLNVSNKIKESFEHQAYFLDHYAVIQYFENLWDVYYLPYKGLSCIAEINDLKNSITFYKWEESKGIFSTNVDTIYVTENVTYLTILSFTNDIFLYHEYFNQNERAIGVLTNINDTGHIIKQWSTNETKYIHAFVLPDTMQKCFVVTYLHRTHPNIYCESTSETGFEVYQELEVLTSSQITSMTIVQNTFLFIIHDDIKNGEVYLDIWKFDENTRHFNSYQSIFDVKEPISVSVTGFRDFYYMALVPGQIQDAVYQRFVKIYRFDPIIAYFIPLQDILISVPINVQFSVVPSGELILYISTNSSTEPLIIYQFEGIAGFKQKYVASNLEKIYNARQFNTIDGNHFVLCQNEKGLTLVRSHFKGHKLG